jgi:tetratricopeptide (TPR) repeat protein
MELARHALRDQRYFDAQTHLQRALRLMDGAIHTADRVAVLSNLARIELAGRHPNEALAYAEQALEASQALEHGPSRMTARLALGQALRASGRRAEALTMLREATAEGALPPEDERMLAGVLFENELLGEAVEVLSKQIASAAGTLDEALARRDLGLMLYRSGDLTGALAAWSPAVAIALDQRQTGLAVQLHCDIGTARRELGQPARALKEYEAALMLISRLGEHEAHIRGIVLSNAATAYAETGDAESADAFFTESIAIAARLGDTAAECTRTGNYGWFLTLVGRPRRAIATLERAIELSEAANLPLQRAVQTDNLGLAYDAMGDTAAALPKHRDALAQVAPLNAPGWQASIQINTAASLFSLNELDEAESLLTAALSTARQLNDPELLIRALTHQAALHLRLGDVAAADLSEAITLARRAEFRRLLAEALSVESQRRAMLGSALEAQSSWAEAARLYTILHMPQGKLHPAWLPA